MRNFFGKIKEFFTTEDIDKLEYSEQMDLQPWNGSEYRGVHYLTVQKLQRILKNCPYTLKFLSLRFRRVDHTFVPPIIQGGFNNLAILSFDFNKLGPQGCRQLAKAEWKALNSLQLQDNQIGDKGLKYLVKMKSPKLQLLSLKSNQITGDGLKVLLKNRFKQLRVLYLQKNKTNYQELKTFVDTPRTVTRLYLTLNSHSKFAADQLKMLLKQSKGPQFYVQVDYLQD